MPDIETQQPNDNSGRIVVTAGVVLGVSCSKLPPLVLSMVVLSELPPANASLGAVKFTLPDDSPTGMVMVWP